jgi:hypothetical protein
VGGLTAAALWTVVAVVGAALIVSEEGADGGSSEGSAFRPAPSPATKKQSVMPR